MHVRMRSIVDGDIFAGALTGRKALSVMLERIDREPETPELLCLDFAGVRVATASFLRESVLEFRDIVRKRWTKFYPIVANANDAIREELSELLKPRRDVIMLCTLREGGVPVAPLLVGELEPKQRITFDLVKKLGEVDAGQLAYTARGSNEEIGQTAWNNRLAALCRLGIVLELNHGRAKRYRPTLEG